MRYLLPTMYFWAGLAVTFAHAAFIAPERDLPPAASILAGVTWPLVTLIWGTEVLF